jgi:CBS domain-containing protein
VLDVKIGSLTLAQPLIVQTGTSVGQVVEEFQKRTKGVVLVCNGNRLIGIMTERDVLMKIVARDVAYTEPVDQFMTPGPVTLKPGNTIGDAITLMNRERFRNIPIINEETGEAVAVFSIRDVINYLAESFPEKVINLPPRPHQTMTTREGA